MSKAESPDTPESAGRAGDLPEADAGLVGQVTQAGGEPAPTSPGRVGAFELPLALRALDDRVSGPGIARTFQKGLALIFALAWLSLAGQILGLIGSRGLMPLAETLAAVRADHPIRFVDFPSVFLWWSSDTALQLGPWLGVAFALAVWLGVWPRLFLGFSTFLYLSCATAGRTFLAFQWDNLLLEAGFLATLLPVHEAGHVARRGAHLLFRLFLFKLYFESGLAKWQSPLGDWRDGSAMSFYYETAPLPTPLGFYAHHLPLAWHHIESWTTLIVELVVPFFIFGPRAARRLAFVVFTLFQFIDFATANYGFFCPLAAWLGIFLLGERDLGRVALATTRATRLASKSVALSLVLRRLRRLRPPGLALPPTAARLVLVAFGLCWCGTSLVEGWALFGPSSDLPSRSREALEEAVAPLTPFRLANTYHLFASVTRERLEPTVEVEAAGVFQELPFRYKPGPVDRPPPFVAPHQPRVDFQLWFHGLAPKRQPEYVARLLGALCEDPSSVAWLFVTAPPLKPRAVRISYWTTHFASRASTPASGADAQAGRWWRRTLAFRTQPMPCEAQ